MFRAFVFVCLEIAATTICPISSAQIAPVHEDVIQLTVTPADYAAVTLNHGVHTKGTLRSEGGHSPPKTFETNGSCALAELTRLFSSLSTRQAATASVSSGAPPFPGPGFYPADLSLLTTTGQTITQAQVHNVYINCSASCWGNPAAFEHDLFTSRFIHVLDQYVGSESNGRYRVGPSIIINIGDRCT